MKMLIAAIALIAVVFAVAISIAETKKVFLPFMPFLTISRAVVSGNAVLLVNGSDRVLLTNNDFLLRGE